MDPINPVDKPRLTLPKLISIFILLLILLAVPVSVIILGQKTREQIKADVSCKQPQIPDPKECVGGQWKLYTNEDACVRFQCVPNK